MRDPVALLDDLGPRSFAVMQLMIGGMLASALLHPLIFLTAAVYAVFLVTGSPLDRWQVALFGLDIVNLAFSYGAFIYLGWHNVLPSERPRFWKLAAAIPFYWMMLSYAAWRAMWELMRTPHTWSKTPHKAL